MSCSGGKSHGDSTLTDVQSAPDVRFTFQTVFLW